MLLAVAVLAGCSEVKKEVEQAENDAREISEAVRKELKRAVVKAKRVNSFKQLGLAMHLYHDANKRFPSQAIRGKDGTPLLSWRVAILPHIGEEELYNQFHRDEPWNSPHNRPLLERMPYQYESPHKLTGLFGPGMTSVVVLTGEGTPFNSQSGPTLKDFSHGSSKTIIVVEAGPDMAVPWTKPQDIPFNKDNPIAALGLIGTKFLALMADGTALKVPSDVDAETLRRLIQYRVGPPVDSGKLEAIKARQ